MVVVPPFPALTDACLRAPTPALGTGASAGERQLLGAGREAALDEYLPGVKRDVVDEVLEVGAAESWELRAVGMVRRAGRGPAG